MPLLWCVRARWEPWGGSLSDQLMASLPERQPRAKQVWLRPLRYAAAVVCVCAMGAMGWFALSSSPDVSQPVRTEAAQMSNDAAFDAAADYAMIDNYDIYACLSEE